MGGAPSSATVQRGPTGPLKSPSARMLSSAATVIESEGSGRSAGPPVTVAPRRGSNRLPWQGQAICWSGVSCANTAQPRWVQMALYATSPAGPGSSPFSHQLDQRSLVIRFALRENLDARAGRQVGQLQRSSGRHFRHAGREHQQIALLDSVLGTLSDLRATAGSPNEATNAADAAPISHFRKRRRPGIVTSAAGSTTAQPFSV